MKKLFLFLILFQVSFLLRAQTAKDVFTATNYTYTWLGIDYSHVKLIGDFSQFQEVGGVSPARLKNTYFPAWNNLVLNERTKYDIGLALRKSAIQYDITEVTAKNAEAPLEQLQAVNAPFYNEEKIQEFVNGYSFQDKSGVGILFLAESLSKSSEEAYYHVVLINLSTKQILIQDRIKGEPSGIGLRNYWASTVYRVIKKIEKTQYKAWKSKYSK
ncbi:MAG: hypothetical protein JWM14_2687 [Chitinophagaceae bacterium]|nr:hypothetical protein [Chitinophagaceae bacterium]